MSGFELLGHDCVYGRYPAPVIPVGRLNGHLVGIYPKTEGGGVSSEVLQADDEFELYAEATRKMLRVFNYTTDRLFAYDKSKIRFYNVAQERPFFLQFLNEQQYTDSDPFLRLMLAKVADERKHIELAIEACFQKLMLSAPKVAPAWYQNELALVQQFGAKSAAASVTLPLRTGKKILIVEDQADIANELFVRFSRAGHDVSVARDGVRATACVAEQRPTLLILDLMLPGKKRLRSTQGNPTGSEQRGYADHDFQRTAGTRTDSALEGTWGKRLPLQTGQPFQGRRCSQRGPR